MNKDEIRFWSKVEKTDSGCWTWNGVLHRGGYGYFTTCKNGVKRGEHAHRFAYKTRHGEITPGKLIDHLCFNRACVNPDHLRETTHKENLENRPQTSRNKSGYRNVYWNEPDKRFQVIVGHNNKLYRGGSYRNLEDAKVAAVALRNSLFTHNDADRLNA